MRFVRRLFWICLAGAILGFVVMVIVSFVVQGYDVVVAEYEANPTLFMAALFIFLPAAAVVTLVAMFLSKFDHDEKERLKRLEDETEQKRQLRNLINARRDGRATDDDIYELLRQWLGWDS